MNHLSAYLDHLSIQSPDSVKLADFFCRALQMKQVKSSKNNIYCEGPERRVVIGPGEKSCLNFAAFRLPSAAELTALREHIVLSGVPLEAAPESFFGDDSFLVRDPDGNCIVFGCAEKNDTKGGMKARLQHFAIGTTNIVAAVNFYHDVLGMRISDQIHADDGSLRTAFLRAGEEHHVVAVFLASKKTFDHHSYEAGDWNLLRDWADYFATHDIVLDWGPGRHGPGNNLFLMIRDPDRNWLEISAELEVVPDEKPTGRWPHVQKTGNSWGVAYLRS